MVSFRILKHVKRPRVHVSMLVIAKDIAIYDFGDRRQPSCIVPPPVHDKKDNVFAILIVNICRKPQLIIICMKESHNDIVAYQLIC